MSETKQELPHRDWIELSGSHPDQFLVHKGTGEKRRVPPSEVAWNLEFNGEGYGFLWCRPDGTTAVSHLISGDGALLQMSLHAADDGRLYVVDKTNGRRQWHDDVKKSFDTYTFSRTLRTSTRWRRTP